MNEERLARARAVLTRMLETDFPEARDIPLATRDRLAASEQHRLPDQDRPPTCIAGNLDPARPSARLSVDAFGHGKAWLMLHAHEGYLDDLELLDAVEFPSPEQLKIRTD